MRWRLSDRAARNGMTAMGSFSIWHWMLFGAVALLLFGGKGKISDLMGDVAKGVKSFKKGPTSICSVFGPNLSAQQGKNKLAFTGKAT